MQHELVLTDRRKRRMANVQVRSRKSTALVLTCCTVQMVQCAVYLKRLGQQWGAAAPADMTAGARACLLLRAPELRRTACRADRCRQSQHPT
jgi:hypothetical protein